MEYYNKVDSAYMRALQSAARLVLFRLELLDRSEKGMTEITTALSSAGGNITVNLSQGCRRTCSLEITDKKAKYLPNRDSPFWYNRKFKIYIGLAVGRDIYWFSQGVYGTKKADVQGCKLSIQGVDKWGFLNGDFKTSMCMQEYQIPVADGGVKISELVKDVLGLDMGNGQPLDPAEPLIDPLFENALLYDEITVNEGGYLGEILTAVAKMYGADIYYDTDGVLHAERAFTYNIPTWYTHLAPTLKIDGATLSEDALNVSHEYDGCNTVTVTTDNVNGEIYSYTAKNENPQSPLNVMDLGIRGYNGSEGKGVVYISLGDTAVQSGQDQCRDYAEYLLTKETVMSVSVKFDYPLTPHLDVDNILQLTAKDNGFDAESFLIQSLTIPLNGEKMQIEAGNILWLPLEV